MCTAALFVTALNWKLLKCPSTVDPVNKVCYTYTTVENQTWMNDPQLYATTGMKLINRMLMKEAIHVSIYHYDRYTTIRATYYILSTKTG